jgi:polyribonucleotide nucleotidyltransferase
MSKIEESFELYGKSYRFETGVLAKQATGSVVVSQGESIMLVTAVISKERKNYDFFPLTVDFSEKMYAAGKIPGGYLKRESRPTDKATLNARTIDRPIRPCFPAGFRNEVQVVASVFTADQSNPVDIIGIMGASAALMVGGAPFSGPVAGVSIGRDRDTQEYVVNPTYDEAEKCDLTITLAGTADKILMVECGADEIPEGQVLAAMEFGQKVLGEFCDVQQRFIDKVAAADMITPKEYLIDAPIEELHNRVFAHLDEMSAALKDADKASRIGKVEALKVAIKAEFSEEEWADSDWARAIPTECKSLEKKAMRAMVIATGERVDGRAVDEIRTVTCTAGYLPLVHGSGLFTRGQTQVLSVATLGMLNEWQRFDTIEPIEGKRYMHHYNFPPYCTGETGRMGAPKRRELGHGALAERALLPVIPHEDEFPYTIRVVSEVLESNGSSSMGSTCGSTLALMDAGVPIKRPVSGVAMGLIKEGDDVVILSDIQGVEDFLGDMDFKVTGTEKGITALQMDNKAAGLSIEILGRALAQAHEGRAFILGKMLESIAEPRAELSSNAPHIITITIPTDKIREVIGSGGKVIRGIQEDTGAQIDIEEDGTIYIASRDEGGLEAKSRIEAIVRVPEVGEEYLGRVATIKDFGAFVTLLPGKDGLLHISRVANGRVNRVEDVLEVGDEVKVKIIDIDERGKISLDRLDKPDAPAGSGSSHAPHGDEHDDHRSHAPRREGNPAGDNHPGRSAREGGDDRQPRRRH